MVYDNMRVPSKNMLRTNNEIIEMTRSQQEEIYAKDAESTIREQAEYARGMEEYHTQIQNRLSDRIASTNNRVQFLQNVKEAFLSECIMKLYRESMVAPMTSNDKVIARNLVTGFVRENGAGDLITNFATKNLLLSEMSRITSKYYDQVLDSITEGENCADCNKQYTLDTTIKDNFYEELEDLDTSEASKLIKDRVTDAITEFVDSNASLKMDISEVISNAKDQSSKATAAANEALIEEYSNNAKRMINEMKLYREKNVFNVMVESLTHKVITDDSYKSKFVHEAKVDMDSIVNNTQLIYTMLEMVNTTNMVNVDDKFISEYLASLA